MKVGIALKDYSFQVPEDALKLFRDRGYEIVYNDTGHWLKGEELADFLADLDAVIGGLELYNKDTVYKAGRLKIVARYGVGMDTMDLPYLKEKGIRVGTIVNHVEVAEFTLALILGMLKNVPGYDRKVKAGGWGLEKARTLKEMTVGIIGFGKIGQDVADRLAPFGCGLLASDPVTSAEKAAEHGARLVDMDTLLKESDIVTVHCPAIPSTYHMIDAAAIAKMKDGAYLVNTSRGSVMDEAAFAAALASGKLAAGAADVYEKEPLPAGSPLRSIDSVILTPHAAAQTLEAYYSCGMICAQSIVNVLEGGEPLYPVI
ncbi:MAG: phosphoglycerate dehydrogenase [Firmicutes bacterium]|nr:phosphoglycerate dehydrogenase [Bacillota bacterium]